MKMDRRGGTKPKWIAPNLPKSLSAGIALRAIVVANALLFLGAMVRTQGGGAAETISIFANMASAAELALLATLGGISLIWERTSEIGRFWAAILLGGAAEAVASRIVSLAPQSAGEFAYSAMLGSMVAAGVIAYFDWRHKGLSPALAEAKLQALQSRIRPHFLFNAINGIAMLVRKSPVMAEDALLDLSDVFRGLMKEQSSMGTVESEIEFTRKYLSIEMMRFGARFTVAISVEDRAKKIQIPSLLIQPLAENAVIHGIEPLGGGELSIRAFALDGYLHIVLENPYANGEGLKERSGNGIALDNVRQRLALLFAEEAEIAVHAKGGVWRSHLKIPMGGKGQPLKAAGHERGVAPPGSGQSGRKR